MDLRSSARDATVLVLLHDRSVGSFLGYLRRLAESLATLRLWNGRVLVVLRPSGSAVEDRFEVRTGPGELASLEQDPGLRILYDEAGATRGWSDADAAVIVADRFGDVYYTASAETPGQLPALNVLEEWLRYLATQCPECGVPDEPGHGEWETGEPG